MNLNEERNRSYDYAYSIEDFITRHSKIDDIEIIGIDMIPNASILGFKVIGNDRAHSQFQNLVNRWAKINNKSIWKFDRDETVKNDPDKYEVDYYVYLTDDKEASNKLDSLYGMFHRARVNESMDERLEKMGYDNYADYLFDLIENGEVDAKEIAKDLAYWVSDRDLEKFLEVRYLLPAEDDL